MTNASIAGAALGAPVKADPYANTQSIEFRFRARRFAHVQRLIEAILAERGRADIVDLGGTETYWRIGADFIRANRHRLSITMINTEPQAIEDRDLFSFHVGSATDEALFADRRFDLVHSNSVIEHVGSWQAMEDFAANARRLAPRYYIQTPNFWFPYEPHFRFPGFQYLPAALRARLIMRLSLGFFRRIDDRAEADDIIRHHRLLSTREMAGLFPDAQVFHEKAFGLNKSIIAMCEGAPRGA
ncbi:methyltransferase domain-containing protein [Aquibium microcysteis]|uniref:methyltransferase domain-containing protein n=1 Tax=Aquibium microcysteis TaxID=675281 RepID=UPI00165D2843|nr:methyltransferase domain-containing protein [Aquibium microcysteis]